MIIQRLLDRLALQPTRHTIATQGIELESRWIETAGGKAELFRRDYVPPNQQSSAELTVLKFLGAAGRAENATDHPLDVLAEQSKGSIWVANPPGYGRSPGRASLQGAFDTALAVCQHTASQQSHIRPVLSGNSLGGTLAICLANECSARGLIVRDMPYISELIRTRWSQFPRVSNYVASKVPTVLDVIHAAKSCRMPALFVSSRKDRIVPPDIQDLVIKAYGGPKQVIFAQHADHMEPLNADESHEYAIALEWLVRSC